MNLQDLRDKKLELETKISQAIYEVIAEESMAPETINVSIMKNRTLSGEEAVSAVYVDVSYDL
jgi:hypothetical protein